MIIMIVKWKNNEIIMKWKWKWKCNDDGMKWK